MRNTPKDFEQYFQGLYDEARDILVQRQAQYGPANIDCVRTDQVQTWEQVNAVIMWLANNKHEFRWLAIDSVDWLEAIIHAQVAADAGKKSIADIGYGAGYKSAVVYWDKLLTGLDWLQAEPSS